MKKCLMEEYEWLNVKTVELKLLKKEKGFVMAYVRRKGRVTIPKEVRDALGNRRGTPD